MYKCCFPNCDYKTDTRSLIEFHHIHLRETGNRLGKRVSIPLCPLHHDRIYHEDATAGQHAQKHPDSMMVKMVTNSTKGKCVIFEDMQGNEYTVDLEDTPSNHIKFIKWDILHGITEGFADDLDEGIAKLVDDDGFYDDTSAIYFYDGYEKVSKALLAKHIASYMEKAKSEFDSALENARNDWKSLKAR